MDKESIQPNVKGLYPPCFYMFDHKCVTSFIDGLVLFGRYWKEAKPGCFRSSWIKNLTVSFKESKMCFNLI